jgi:hypothetical protein
MSLIQKQKAVRSTMVILARHERHRARTAVAADASNRSRRVREK